MKAKALAIMLVVSLASFFCFASSVAIESPYDYSNHADPYEHFYTTDLTDLSLLKNGAPLIVARENPTDTSWYTFQGFDTKDAIWGYDLIGLDISKEDLSAVEDVSDLSFSTKTIWPDQLPEGFDPVQILEYNKNPGLGIRALHAQGIVGEGVGIAILDQTLLVDHEQYKGNLMLYERIHHGNYQADLHGAAVASIAVGKDIGTAPGSKLYYIAREHTHQLPSGDHFYASVIADCILRVLEINEQLPDNEKIRVISCSRGYSPSDDGYEALIAAMQKAEAENIFVITTSPERYYGFSLMGMERDYDKDPDDVRSYEPASWIMDEFRADPYSYSHFIFVPMGSRTFASSTGERNYAICRNGGLSWAVPWLAGFYAMCCQVKPDITPNEFIQIIRDTATITELSHGGKTYSFGPVVNPAAVIQALRDTASMVRDRQ